MNASSWLKKAKKRISALDAELILMEVLALDDRSELVIMGGRELSEAELDRVDKMLVMRADGKMPLAYLTHHREFYGREFYVDNRVLIPRPETEDIIGLVKEYYPQDKERPLLLDIGTGSGCIAITLALEFPEAAVEGIDISQSALEVALRNMGDYAVRNVRFLHGNLLGRYKSGRKPDILVANLPYVDRNWEWLSPEIKHEPKGALFADNGGLDIIFRLLDEIQALWKDDTVWGMKILLEADISQHERIKEYAEGLGIEYLETRNYIVVLNY